MPMYGVYIDTGYKASQKAHEVPHQYPRYCVYLYAV